MHRAAGIQDVIAVGVAHSFAAVGRTDAPGDFLHALNGVLAFKQQHHHAAARARGRVGAIFALHVISQKRPNVVIHLQVRANQLRVGLRQFLVGRKHARRHKVQPRAADVASNDAAGARLGNRVRVNQYKGEFLDHRGFLSFKLI